MVLFSSPNGGLVYCSVQRVRTDNTRVVGSSPAWFATKSLSVKKLTGSPLPLKKLEGLSHFSFFKCVRNPSCYALFLGPYLRDRSNRIRSHLWVPSSSGFDPADVGSSLFLAVHQYPHILYLLARSVPLDS